MPSTFLSLGVPADLVARLAKGGITEPYPIQRDTLVDSLAGRDICAQSPTGSGKTLAYGLPVVAHVKRAKPKRPKALILAPARELAAQIANELRPLAAAADRRVATFYGGTGFGNQLDALRRGVDIAVACPGRLIDLLERRAVDLRDVQIVVIDEADRMADMGFLPAVRRLLDEMGHERQTMLFTATLSKDVERLVREYQDSPARFVLDAPADQMGSRTHEFRRTPREHRVATTTDLVSSYSSSIVFCRTKRGADRLARQLTQSGVAAVALHGDRTQAQRDRALAQFRAGRAQVLVGTDVASRGLHIEGVDCVVHFDPPEDDDTYIHRSGRTGRAGSEGVVVSLVARDQESAARKLQGRLGLDTGFLDIASGGGGSAVTSSSSSPSPIRTPEDTARRRERPQSASSETGRPRPRYEDNRDNRDSRPRPGRAGGYDRNDRGRPQSDNRPNPRGDDRRSFGDSRRESSPRPEGRSWSGGARNAGNGGSGARTNDAPGSNGPRYDGAPRTSRGPRTPDGARTGGAPRRSGPPRRSGGSNDWGRQRRSA